MLCIIIFFFQAEDGIRDTSVTGVQTCALPILQSYKEYIYITLPSSILILSKKYNNEIHKKIIQ